MVEGSSAQRSAPTKVPFLGVFRFSGVYFRKNLCLLESRIINIFQYLGICDIFMQTLYN